MTDDVGRGRNAYMLATARETMNKGFIVGALLSLVTAGILDHAGFPTWRVAAITLGYFAFMLAQRWIILSTPTAEAVDDSITRVNVLAQLYMTTSATLTGGLTSPLIPTLALSAIFSLIFFGPHRRASGLVLLLAILIAIMAAMPVEVTGPPIERGHYIAVVVIAMAWTLFAIRMFVSKVTEATHAASCAIDDLREDRLADAEAQARRLQSVGAKVAHELKNPLAAIKGLVQLVKRAPDNGKTDERLAVVEAEIDRMESILREYLSFARPLEDLHKEPTDLAEVAQEVVSVLAGRMEQGRIVVETATAPAPIDGDPRRLKEALINLLANAIDATPPGGRIRIVTRAGGGGGVVEIRDTGRGMASDVLDRLGTSFFTTRANGTGLGVVLALGVVAQHGGALHVASEPGRGTHITITLPASGTPSPGASITTSRHLPAENVRAA
jgi:two-component system sensor histidine kinase HydH